MDPLAQSRLTCGASTSNAAWPIAAGTVYVARCRSASFELRSLDPPGGSVRSNLAPGHPIGGVACRRRNSVGATPYSVWKQRLAYFAAGQPTLAPLPRSTGRPSTTDHLRCWIAISIGAARDTWSCESRCPGRAGSTVRYTPLATTSAQGRPGSGFRSWRTQVRSDPETVFIEPRIANGNTRFMEPDGPGVRDRDPR